MNGFYWVYFVMFGMTLWHHFTPDREKKRLIYWGSCFFLILLFAVQDASVSVDNAEYMRQFELIPTLTFGQMLTHKFEISFVLICRILSAFPDGARLLLLVIGLLIMIPFAHCFERDTSHPMVAMMAFVALGMHLHGLIFIRQLAAMAILAWGYRFITERKFWHFLLSVALAMSFHKMSVVFLPVYILYAFPVNKWLLAAAAAAAVVGGVFCKPIMNFILTYVYEYHPMFHIADGGYNLLMVLWILVLFSWWLLGDRMDDPKVRLPFLMALSAAALQPICFAFYNWLRVVLFFRIALVPLCAELYVALFCRKDGNRALALVEKISPRLSAAVLSIYDKKWFRTCALVALFAVLFVWYLTELDDAVYIMAPLA